MIGALLKFFLVGFITILVLGVVLAVVGTAFGLAVGVAALLLKLAPILLVGYVVVRLLRPKSREPQISAEDRKWLES